MKEYIGRTFNSLHDRGEALSLGPARLVECEFVNCHLSLTKVFEKRSTVRGVHLQRCSVKGGSVGPAILEEVTVEDLASNDLLLVWGALFRHVKLSGRIGKLKLNPFVDPVDRSVPTQGPLEAFRERYYGSVDWALDISEARFVEFDFRGIPARLVRRDPESQVVVTRGRALAPGWRDRVSSSNRLWPFVIRLFLQDGDQDIVLVAPLGAPRRKRDELLAGLRELRALGVAEPD